MSQKLWVQHETPVKTYGPTRVSIDGCTYIAQFLNTLYARPLLAIPQNAPIALYHPDGKTEIKPTTTIKSLGDAGKDGDAPLVVKTTAPSTQVQPTALFSPCEIPFYNSICNASERDGWISFGQNIPSTTLNNLYIRESYRTIASCINPGINKAIITGTPGIGKSLFMFYLLWKLVKAGKRALFIYHPHTIYYDGKGSVFQFPSNALPSYMDYSFWNEDLWCLFDAKEKTPHDLGGLPYPTCTFVLSTFPRREMVNDFKKPPPPEVFYMPLWTETELETIAQCFPTAIDWHNRFKTLGGIPRHVLEVARDNPTKLLQAACKLCDLDDCVKIIGLESSITEKSKIVHSLVHMKSALPFTEPSVTFASQTALAIIVEIKGKEAKLKRGNFWPGSREIP
jgi:hypothetical protein